MKISVLGGGSEIGASCLHVEMDETAVLIDAGMRVHGDDLLPAFGMLDQLKKPEAILVTHAHADHIGALPVVHRLYPDVPIFATPPTADLMQIMMRDSYKIMEQRCLQTRTLMPYTKEEMHATLQAVRVFPASAELTIGGLKVSLSRAGHILGAVMFLIKGIQQSILVSGDLSFQAGRTIPGAQVPAGTRPDALILESTYGNRNHSDRNTEEKRLADNVAEVVAGGGFALIPAFALGRAQEVLLILQDYMDQGLIPEFPIFVDGLVTPISKIYRHYPQFLKGPIAHRIRTHGDVFLTEGRCTAVQPKEREAVLSGKPGCIVASSGMLIGGASVWYAERLIGQEKNSIFITGYQDEESPGRKLLSLADGKIREIELNGTMHQVKCRVDKYGLSAHADASELNRFVKMVRPGSTLLVHGDPDARTALCGQIERRYQPLLSENGEMYPFDHLTRGRAQPQRQDPFTQLRELAGQLLLYRKEATGQLKPVFCSGVSFKTRSLICQTLKGKKIRIAADQIAEILGPWNQSFDKLQQQADQVLAFSLPYLKRLNWTEAVEGRQSYEEVAGWCLPDDELDNRLALALILQSLPERFRKTDEKGRNRYLINPQSLVLLRTLQLPVQGLRRDAASALSRVREILAAHPHFVRCGLDQPDTAEAHITIYFDFPDVLSEAERAQWRQQITEDTGWRAEISPSVRTDLLQNKIDECFEQSGPASIHLDTKTIDLGLPRSPENEERAEKIFKESGFTIQFQGDAERESLNPKASGGIDFFQSQTHSERLENNEAIGETKRWAEDRGITLYKAGIKTLGGQTCLEVHFITPEIALRHTVDMEELSYRTGFPVTFARHPKQNEILRAALETIPPDWGLQKNPALHTDRAQIGIKLPVNPPEAEVSRVRSEIKEKTGYSVVLEVR
ncbi:MAG: MBL fold metallo-hydrolase [Sporolactobacillus sp.]